MEKAELAQYLVNLHTLMEAQSRSGHSRVSAALAWEYERQWDVLGDIIKQEKDNETGSVNENERT